MSSSKVMLSQATAGDPRRPAEVRRFEAKPNEADDVQPNGMLLLGMLCGTAGMFFKMKIFVWASCFFALASAATRRIDNWDIQQFAMLLMFSAGGLGTYYLLPQPLDGMVGTLGGVGAAAPEAVPSAAAGVAE